MDALEKSLEATLKRGKPYTIDEIQDFTNVRILVKNAISNQINNIRGSHPNFTNIVIEKLNNELEQLPNAEYAKLLELYKSFKGMITIE